MNVLSGDKSESSSENPYFNEAEKICLDSKDSEVQFKAFL